MKLKYVFYKLNVIVFLALILSACGGGGGGSGSSGSGSEPAVVPSGQVTEESTILHGSVGDGPVVGATIKVFDKDGNLLLTQSSDATANYEVTVRATGNAYPLLVEASNGTDIVTDQKPDFVLKSFVMSPGKKKRVNINPFSTMIVEVAQRMPGGLTSANIDAAGQIVLSQFNFGFDAALLADPVSGTIDENNVASLVKSSETFGEMLRRSRDALQLTTPGITADKIIAILAADMVDGVVDGNGAAGVDARVAAVTTIASAQVLTESMTGQLQVNGVDATGAMNYAVLVTQPGISADVNAVPVVSEMLTQARTAVVAAQAVDTNTVYPATADALLAVQPGSLPADIAAVMPGDIDTALSATLGSVLQASDAEVEQLNVVVRNGGDVIAPVNTAPIISGVAQPTVEVNTDYSFVPQTSDAEGDVLTFSISNLPQWGSFDAATGTLSGVPGSGDVGVFDAIVISVSDGEYTTALPAFSIAVTAVPNAAPSISGVPANAVVENTAYSFFPEAIDADGDTLSFGITNRPQWASFDTRTGALTGTPKSSDIGVTSGIVISVTDGVDIVSLPAFYVSVTAVPNTAPMISGTPAISVEENTGYSFVPTASDVDGDALSFSVSGLPSWASFNTVNGAISGTPGSADVGVHGGIVISVSDGIATASLPAFSIQVTAAPNAAPVISGTPATSVVENVAYSFVPTATDADGDTLSFSVTNLPSWASFNAATGAIIGTPSSADVGVHNGIVVSVTDGTKTVSLPAFDITVTSATANMGTATLSWLPPTENTDGTVLTDLAGYKIYYGTTAGNYTNVITVNNAGITSYVVENLPAGNTYYFVVTAFTTSGVESGYSTAGSKSIP